MENKEENMTQSNNGKKVNTSLIAIILLLIVILILGGFILINKDKLFGEKDENTPEVVETEEEQITISEEELQKYVDYISPVSIGPSAKLYNVDKVDASKLTTREKMEYIGHALYEKQTSSSDNQYSIIAEEDAKEITDKIYGPGTYERTTFNLGCGDYKLNEDDNKYYSQTGCGGTTDKISVNVVVDYKATKERIEITTAYVFTNSEFRIYKDYDYTEELDTFTSDYEGMVPYLKTYAKENKDKLNHITYVFESTDGQHYYFKEYTNNR